MTRHNMDDVDEKLRQAVESYVDRTLAQVLDNVELRIAQQLARAGKPQHALELLSLNLFDLGARIDDLENVKQVRPATPEQYTKMAAEWKQAFPGSEPPSSWALGMGQK